MILRICVCIPVFNNPRTINKVIEDCLENTSFPIWIIDDGSDTSVEQSLSAKSQEAFKSGRLKIIRHPENLGKGAAIRTAIEACVVAGFTHLLTLDGDGQHLVSEISKLVALAQRHPWDLIIGARKLAADEVPGISKFGRKFSNFWVNFETDQKISDSQSGMRLYPLLHLQTMGFWTRHYDFEIEVLIRLLWKGVRIREADIEVYYPPSGRVSHFRKFRDNLRISLLNTVLVVLSLMKDHRSSRRASLAVGFGVFVGCTPFYGLHTFIVGGISFLFRLNFVYLWLGSQISIPILAPFLVAAALSIGQLFHLHHALQFFVGCCILGATLGTVLGLLTYFAMQRQKLKRENARNWQGRTRGGKFGNGFLKLISRTLGLRATYFCLLFIVPYFYLFAPKARHASNEYWKITNPKLGVCERQWKVLTHLYRFGTLLLDRVHQSFQAKPAFQVISTGRQEIKTAIDSKKGLILLSAHAGAWDLAAALLSKAGFNEKFCRVHFEANGLRFEQFLEKSDPEQQSETLATNQVSEPIWEIRRLLEQGKSLGLMGDRPLNRQFELVSFFGKLVPLDITPFRIAAACQSPLLFAFGFKNNRETYDFFAFPAQTYAYHPGKHKLISSFNWVQSYARVLEGMLKRYPDQWANFFAFWSSIPDHLETEGASSLQNTAQNHLIEELGRPQKVATERAADAMPTF